MNSTAAGRPLLLSGGLHAAAERWPGKPAMVCADVTRTYGMLATRVRQLCGAAQAMGLRQGDRVAVLAPNCVEYQSWSSASPTPA
jgi:acyl-CoA synthetase (AMP-forming)/AMP-acid ligase II